MVKRKIQAQEQMGKVIVYCLDKNYIPLAEISIRTVKEHNPESKIVIVSESRIVVRGADEYFVCDLGGRHRNRGLGDRISNAAYLKLLLPKLPYDKIIFLDGDTIVQHSLDEIWNEDVGYIGLTESHSYGKKQALELGLKKYGLSGFMLMNLKNLRAVDFTRKCFEVERKIPDLKTGFQHDETIINWVLKDKLTFLPLRYHYCHARLYDKPIPEKDAIILHIVGKDKSYMQMHYGEPRKVLRYPELAQIEPEINGKRIAIVGNAKSIFDKKNGDDIDNHDFVIRFNKGFICDPKSQGIKTSLLILACPLEECLAKSFHSKYIANRSKSYRNMYADFTINNTERAIMKEGIGSQPSSGFMAINICLSFGASHIDLYGFDWEATPTFYNDPNYVTLHDYNKEHEIIKGYVSAGLVSIY